MKILRDTIAKQPSVRLADGYEALCDSQHCPVVKNERIFYSDGDHLTGSGAKHTLSSIQNEFTWFAQSQTK